MKRLACVIVVLGIWAATSCSSEPEGPASRGTAAEPASQTLTVFAASSLTDAFDVIATDVEAQTGIDVTFNFGSSTDLAEQIQSEETADAFAAASGTAMDTVEEDPGVEDRTDFVTNRLVIITPPDNPAGIESIEDLAEPGVQLVLGAEGVPVGDYAREALANAGIDAAALDNVVSNEPDNASVVAKVTSGEADAAIVYTSDVSAAAGNDVAAIEIPDDVNVLATYPIAVVTGASNASGAEAFLEYVTGREGQATLVQYGFGEMPS